MPNNLGLLLDILHENKKIDLRKNAHAIGYWSFAQLAKRLVEKHSRTAFVKARNTPAPAASAGFGLKSASIPAIRVPASFFVNFNPLHANIRESDKNFPADARLDPDGKTRFASHEYSYELVQAST
jgi:hypothetical protein